jgi:hypothetical protein
MKGKIRLQIRKLVHKFQMLMTNSKRFKLKKGKKRKI